MLRLPTRFKPPHPGLLKAFALLTPQHSSPVDTFIHDDALWLRRQLCLPD